MPDVTTVPAGSTTIVPSSGGMDAMTAALLAGQNGGLFGGNSNNWLLPLLLLSGRGLFGAGWGGAGYGPGAGGYGAVGPIPAAQLGLSTGLAEAQAISTMTSAKDAVAATQAAKDVLTANVERLSKQLCCSTNEVTEAVNAITPQLFQGFAQVNSNLCSGFANLNTALNTGFNATNMALVKGQGDLEASIDRTSSAIELQIANTAAQASAQAASIAATQQLQATLNAQAAALAHCQTQNLIQSVGCDIKNTVTTDGALTRALIQATNTDNLRAELSDAKAALNTAAVSAKTQEQINAAISTIVKHFPQCGSH